MTSFVPICVNIAYWRENCDEEGKYIKKESQMPRPEICQHACTKMYIGGLWSGGCRGANKNETGGDQEKTAEGGNRVNESNCVDMHTHLMVEDADEDGAKKRERDRD